MDIEQVCRTYNECGSWKKTAATVGRSQKWMVDFKKRHLRVVAVPIVQTARVTRACRSYNECGSWTKTAAIEGRTRQTIVRMKKKYIRMEAKPK